MLINVLKLPSLDLKGIDRRFIISQMNDYSRTTLPLKYFPTVFGSYVEENLSPLYKTIHIAQSPQTIIFESVFVREETNLFVALYTKIITPGNSCLGISKHAITAYQRGRSYKNDLHSLPNLVSISETIQFNVSNWIADNIVPPIFGFDILKQQVYRICDIITQIHHYGVGEYYPKTESIGMQFKPIYDHIPHILLNLIKPDGLYNPLGEILYQHPSIQISQPKFSLYEEVKHDGFVKQGQVVEHDPAFDQLAILVMDIPVSSFSISCSFKTALDCLKDLWLFHKFQFPYRTYFYGKDDFKYHYEKTLMDLFYMSVYIYTKKFKIDINDVFIDDNKIHLTISKNIYDEVCFTINDYIHNIHVSYYSFIPLLALTTQSVGSY